MKMLFIGILMFSVLSACSSYAAAQAGSLSTGTPQAPATPLPRPTHPSDLQYSTVAEALADLKTRDDVSIEVMQGWTIVREADGLTNWSFPPPDHPAYPALAKRILYRDEAGWHLRMDVLCEATSIACEEFVQYFEMINAPMYEYIAQHQ